MRYEIYKEYEAVLLKVKNTRSKRGVYVLFGVIILFIWMIVLICSEITIFKLLFKRNLHIWCLGIIILFLSILATLISGVWS